MTGDLICAKIVQRKLGNVSHMFLRRRLVDDPSFPKPIRLAKAKRFWRVSEIDAWIDARARLTTQEGGAV